MPGQGGHPPAAGGRHPRHPRQEPPGVGVVSYGCILEKVVHGFRAEKYGVTSHYELQLLTPGIDEGGPPGGEGDAAPVPDHHPRDRAVSTLAFPG